MNEVAKRDKYLNLMKAGNINREEYKALLTLIIEDKPLHTSEIQDYSLLDNGKAVETLASKGYLEMVGGKYQIKDKS